MRDKSGRRLQIMGLCMILVCLAVIVVLGVTTVRGISLIPVSGKNGGCVDPNLAVLMTCVALLIGLVLLLRRNYAKSISCRQTQG